VPAPTKSLVELRSRRPTSDPEVLALRARQTRASLVTLLLPPACRCCWAATSSAAPARQQQRLPPGQRDHAVDRLRSTETCCGLQRSPSALCRGHPVSRRRRYLSDKAAADLRWFPAGTAMTHKDWVDPARNMAVFIDGATDPDIGTDRCRSRCLPISRASVAHRVRHPRPSTQRCRRPRACGRPAVTRRPADANPCLNLDSSTHDNSPVARQAEELSGVGGEIRGGDEEALTPRSHGR
jgi:hypothetical protein